MQARWCCLDQLCKSDICFHEQLRRTLGRHGPQGSGAMSEQPSVPLTQEVLVQQDSASQRYQTQPEAGLEWFSLFLNSFYEFTGIIIFFFMLYISGVSLLYLQFILCHFIFWFFYFFPSQIQYIEIYFIFWLSGGFKCTFFLLALFNDFLKYVCMYVNPAPHMGIKLMTPRYQQLYALQSEPARHPSFQ